MSTTDYVTTTVAAPDQEPVVHDSANMTLDTIESIAYDSPHGTFVYTQRGIYECRRAGENGLWLSHNPGNPGFSLGFMVHVLITERLPIV